MSKKSKLKSAERRKAEKLSRKIANKAMYRKWAEDGVNTKSKRAVRKSAKSSAATKGMHIGIHDCGNIGCKRCNPMEKVA